jgi:hypothetical protein
MNKTRWLTTRSAAGWRCKIVSAAAVMIAIGLMADASRNTAQAQVPSINIVETCWSAAGVMYSLSIASPNSQSDADICLDSETKAQQQLTKDWSSYQSADRQGCIQPGTYLPSYVEWLTCLEMNRYVRDARQQGWSINPVVNPDGSMTLPSVRRAQMRVGYSE